MKKILMVIVGLIGISYVSQGSANIVLSNNLDVPVRIKADRFWCSDQTYNVGAGVTRTTNNGCSIKGVKVSYSDDNGATWKPIMVKRYGKTIGEWLNSGASHWTIPQHITVGSRVDEDGEVVLFFSVTGGASRTITYSDK